MSDSPTLSRMYMNHKIEFHSTDLKFHVSGPEFDQYRPEYCTFPSFDEARAKIDSEVSAAQKLAAQNFKFKETILDSRGEKHEITRINRGTGDIQGVEDRYVYPNLDWVEASLRLAAQLTKELNELEDRLSPLRIATSRGYGRVAPETYISKLQNLQKSINEKRELAEQNCPAEPQAQVINLKS